MILLQQLISGVALGGLYALLALSFTFVIGVLNFLNFSLPGIFMLGGMSSWALIALYGVDWRLSILAAVIIGALASLLVERFTYRFMRVRFGDATEHAIPLVSSIGFLILFQGIAAIRYGRDLKAFPSPWSDPNVRIAGLLLSVPNLLSLVLAIASVALLALFLERTRVGRAIRAIAESPATATVIGVDVNRIVPVVFAITGMFSALAGVLFALNYLQVSSHMGDDVAPAGIAAMVIGGLGNVWGAVIGGVLIGLLEVLSSFFLGAKFIKVVIWGALLLLLVVRPTGIFGQSAVGKGKF